MGTPELEPRGLLLPARETALGRCPSGRGLRGLGLFFQQRPWATLGLWCGATLQAFRGLSNNRYLRIRGFSDSLNFCLSLTCCVLGWFWKALFLFFFLDLLGSSGTAPTPPPPHSRPFSALRLDLSPPPAGAGASEPHAPPRVEDANRPLFAGAPLVV